jgi:hypothetical protein
MQRTLVATALVFDSIKSDKWNLGAHRIDCFLAQGVWSGVRAHWKTIRDVKYTLTTQVLTTRILTFADALASILPKEDHFSGQALDS